MFGVTFGTVVDAPPAALGVPDFEPLLLPHAAVASASTAIRANAVNGR
jgi:hypothetical protein